MKSCRFLGYLAFTFALVLALAQARADETTPTALRGQSVTMLPDGQLLLLGGMDSSNRVLSAAFLKGNSPVLQPLASGLVVARAGHTATVLPDGTVLVFGGVGADGKIISAAELFDPVTLKFSVLSDVVAVPRAYHTATLLTDGSLLLAGGVETGGEFPDDIQLWDFRTRKALSQHALLMTPREGHTATLLADGAVRISGGTDHFGRPVLVDEIYDPGTKRFRFASQSEMAAVQSQGEPSVAESVPADGAVDVPIDTFIGLRFRSLLNLSTATSDHFVLATADQSTVEAKITAAENGRLVFVVPSSPLEPGTSYTLQIIGAADTSGAEVTSTSVNFTTAGEPPEGTGPDWIPNSSWTAPDGTTQFQSLPPLQAAPGATALAGQVLKLNGRPLEHVTLEMEGKKAETDHTGRFLLPGLTAGHHVLWIDGATASAAEASYGVYEVGVTISPDKTNVLNYTIWMTRLDKAHAVTIPSPTTTETVITNPNLPGLEFHLPANTVITDWYGRVVHEVGITAIPLNKPPFPLPAGVQVPIYFTIQPGGAYIKVLGSGKGPKGGRLIYPNTFHQSPGTPFDFWNYDADAKGWFIYGHGHVSPDARQVIPDPGVVVYELTGAMVGTGGAGQQACMDGPRRIACPRGADPVSLATGEFIYEKTDLALADILPMTFARTYHSADSFSRSFGVGATNNYDIFMVGDVNPYTYQELILPDGARVRFDRISSGTSYSNAVYVNTGATSPFYGALLTFGQTSDTWEVTLTNGTVYTFPDSSGSTNPFCQALIQITDRYGNILSMTRAPKTGAVTDCELMSVSAPNSPDGRYINFTHDGQGRITQAQDNTGRTVGYAYDSAGRLSTVTDVNAGLTTFTYDDSNRLLTIKDARGIVYLTNQYDSSGRVIQQTQADTGTYLFSWTGSGNTVQSRTFGGVVVTNGSELVSSGCWSNNVFNRYSSACAEGYLPLVAQVDVTDPRGYVREVKFDSTGYVTSDTHALGQPEQQTVTYAYYADNTAQSVTDALARVSTFDYDALGNPVRATLLGGTSNAVTTTWVYGGPFNGLTSMTDPLGHTSTFSYDLTGNLTAATDALNHQVTFGYNGVGQVTSATDAIGHSTQFGYFGADLASVTDPLGNVSTQFVDGAGRVQSSADALGNRTRLQYNPLNLLSQVTDARGNNTTFSYDPNGNLLSLTDALNHPTAYTYDNMDRVQTRTDPLLRPESYTYDLNGNVASATDRKGQVTTFNYDGLNRLKFVGFNTVVNGGNTTYESTISYTYDAGNRLTQAVDSAGGTITDAYDGLDRLTGETTAQGSISYAYDAANRPTTMQVAGQPAVNYTYDNANRLTQISQSSSTTSFNYDIANRRTSLTLPNGVVVSYSYDADSHLTGITYQLGPSTLGNLSYAYDQLGRRVQVGGALSRTNLPAAVASAAYDAANELTNWNGTNLSYDANGNMLSDGVNTFTWNARNQVATLNNVSLQYDAFGRRIKNAAGISFLYDGANAVQELSGTTVTANLLSGSIDEVFTRADASGAFAQLKDALGSTIALVDSNGNSQTVYTYDPFGNTSVTGISNANEFQYTGRENEGNGLYFYRARYYLPLLGRFINEDPLGFRGGINFYEYVASDPIDFLDPLGLNWVDDWLKHASDLASGAGDTLTFGGTRKIREWMGTESVVDHCSWWYIGGQASGIALSIAIGGGAGAEAAEANAGREGFEFSHFWPDRWGGPRSIFNGNFVSQRFHYLTDFYRYPLPAGALLRWGPKLPPGIQQILRIPWVYLGLGAGAAYGTGGAMAGRNCGCH